MICWEKLIFLIQQTGLLFIKSSEELINHQKPIMGAFDLLEKVDKIDLVLKKMI